MKWKRKVRGMLGNSTAAVADDDSVYVASDTGHLYAFDADGGSRWSTPMDELAVTSPEVAGNGTVLFGVKKLREATDCQDRLKALDRSGALAAGAQGPAAGLPLRGDGRRQEFHLEV